MGSAQGHLTKEQLVQNGLALDTGFCTLCGLCVAVCPVGALTLIQPGGEPRIAFGTGCNDCGICYRVCPGKDVPLRDLDVSVFGRERDPGSEWLGISKGCYQANATDPEIRAKGASGGVVTALLVYALEKKLVSAAAVVVMDKEEPWRAKSVLATTREEIVAGASSKYVIVPVNAVLARPEVRKLTGALACVGLPCHVHGLRKLQHLYPNHFLSKKIAFVVGIHCGLGATTQLEDMLKKHFEVQSLADVKSLSYRKGKATDAGGAYGEVVKANGEVMRREKYVWSTPQRFIASRCMLCWDWGAELSDVSACDFFGPAASGSEAQLGASTLIVRTQKGEELVKQAVEEGYLKVYPTPIDPLLRSSGFMRKKFGRATALMTLQRYGLPCPNYQYQIEPIEMVSLEETSLASGVSAADREQFWARRGVRALS